MFYSVQQGSRYISLSNFVSKGPVTRWGKYRDTCIMQLFVSWSLSVLKSLSLFPSCSKACAPNLPTRLRKLIHSYNLPVLSSLRKFYVIPFPCTCILQIGRTHYMYMYVNFTYKKNPPCTCILQIHVGRTQTLNEDTWVWYWNWKHNSSPTSIFEMIKHSILYSLKILHI
jgi:hypothetical protein